jgi:hypothetical protein
MKLKYDQILQEENQASPLVPIGRKGFRRKYEDGTKWISYNIPEAEQNI